MKSFIFSVLIGIIALFTAEVSTQNRFIIAGSIVILMITLLSTYKHEYIKKFKSYSFSYYGQVLVLLLLSICLIFENYITFDSNYISIPLIIFQLVIMFPIGIYAYVRYRKGIYLFLPTLFRVPVSGRDLELSLENKTPFESGFKIEIILSQNVIFKDGSNKYAKEGIIRAKGKINLKVLIKSNQNRFNKRAKVTLDSDLNSKEDYYLNMIT